MVLVRMGAEDIIQRCDIMAFKIAVYKTAVSSIAAVNKHGVPATESENSVCLTDVDEMNLKLGERRCVGAESSLTEKPPCKRLIFNSAGGAQGGSKRNIAAFKWLIKRRE